MRLSGGHHRASGSDLDATVRGTSSGEWLSLEDARAIGISRTSFYERFSAEVAKSRLWLVRDEGRGRRFVHRDALSNDERRAWQRLLADRLKAEARRVELGSKYSEQGAEILERLSAIGDVTAEAHYECEAQRRLELLLEYEALSPKYIKGAPNPRAVEITQEWRCKDPVIIRDRKSWAKPISLRTLENYRVRYREVGFAALLPPRWSAPKPGDRRVLEYPPDVADAIRKLRLVAFPNLGEEQLYKKARERLGDVIGSVSTFRRRLRALVPRDLDVFARKGERTYAATVQTYVPRSTEELDVCELLVGDHHQFDVEVINPERNGALDRPWLTAFVDMKTRAFVGWHISFQPNARAIKYAFRRAIEPKPHDAYAMLCGIPASVYIDNGKDFRAGALEGVEGMFTLCGVKVIHAIPFNAKAKTAVERQFGTVVELFSRAQPAYCGRSTDERTERYRAAASRYNALLKKGRRDPSLPFPTLEQFRASFEMWLLEYLERPHEGLADEATGRVFSPAAIAAERRLPPRLPTSDQLAALTFEATTRVVQKGYVQRDGVLYTADELYAYEGVQVTVRFDPLDLREVLVFDRAKFVCRAAMANRSQQRADGTLDQAALDYRRRFESRKKKLRDEYARLRLSEGAGTVDEAAAMLLGPEPARLSAPSSPEVAPPPEAVTALLPVAASIARAMETPRAEPPANDTGESTVRLMEESDEAYVVERLSHRPEMPPEAHFLDEGSLAFYRQRQAEWDAAAARLIAERNAARPTR
jgi:transposase InsO family protein